MADNGSGDSSEDNDGKKGDIDEEVDYNSVDRTDENNQVHSAVEIEVEDGKVPDSYVHSFP